MRKDLIRQLKNRWISIILIRLLKIRRELRIKLKRSVKVSTMYLKDGERVKIRNFCNFSK